MSTNATGLISICCFLIAVVRIDFALHTLSGNSGYSMSICLRSLILIGCCSLAAFAGDKTVTFHDPLGEVEVGLPAIGDDLDQAERELAPKLTKELRFVSKSGSAAVLVATRIRPELPKDDRVLERVEPKYRNFKGEHGDGEVVLEFRGKSPHRTLEFAVANGEYQEAFPYVVGGEISAADPPKSVTISQFFVSHERMFEAAIYLPNSEKASRAELLARARQVCDDWRSKIVVKQ